MSDLLNCTTMDSIYKLSKGNTSTYCTSELLSSYSQGISSRAVKMIKEDTNLAISEVLDAAWDLLLSRCYLIGIISIKC